MSIFPYIYYMIQDFAITDNEKQIAMYAGMVTSAFAFAEFSAGVPWGKVSDRIGRKPVLLTGLAGTALSMLIFGFAPNLPVALLARALGGLLNGNIGVLQTTVAEMITVKEHQPRAYTIMPFVWCLGSILGPALGGALARPALNYPTIFLKDSIWARFPYLLPNLVCTVIVLCGVVVGILFLEETHAEKKHRRDPGLEAGKWIIAKFSGDSSFRREKITLDEVLPLLDEQSPPGYSSSMSSSQTLSESQVEQVWTKPPMTKAFTTQVITNIVGYGFLAYHTMTFDAMLPLLLSSKRHTNEPQQLPFKFVGGYKWSTAEIGVVLSVQGVYSMLVTIFLFPIVVRRLGPLRLFRILTISYPILYLTTPYLVVLPDSVRVIGLYAIVFWKCTFSTMAYPANAILLTNSAPSLLQLGTINGVGASVASLARAFGPTVSGVLFSTGLRIGYSGLAWWCSAAIAVAGAFISLRMTDEGGRMAVDEKTLEVPKTIEEHVDDHCLDPTLSAADSRRDSTII